LKDKDKYEEKIKTGRQDKLKPLKFEAKTNKDDNLKNESK
jgi:hypothetical protein